MEGSLGLDKGIGVELLEEKKDFLLEFFPFLLGFPVSSSDSPLLALPDVPDVFRLKYHLDCLFFVSNFFISASSSRNWCLKVVICSVRSSHFL